MTKSQLAIVRLLELSDLTQRGIADVSGNTPQQIQDWKSGRRKPSLENFIKLCESTGVSIKDVFDVPNDA